MDRTRFEELVERALLKVPATFRSRIQNLAIIVEDEPSSSDLRAGRVGPGHTLLGLYQGVPLTKRSWSSSPPFPDRIALFQGPIERATDGSDEAIEHQAALTLFHELGHYFGMNEAQVRRMEARLVRGRRR